MQLSYIWSPGHQLEHVQFVVSKTRVAPIRLQTIPRLELLSALLLARLMSTTIKALLLSWELQAPRYYGDSQVTLYWIHGQGKQWKPFVQNWPNEIAKLTDKSSWRHCPGKENAADLPSRGITPIELSVSALWRCGPPWIKGDDNALSPEPVDMPSDCASELKGASNANAHIVDSEPCHWHRRNNELPRLQLPVETLPSNDTCY